jgi:hypothetical protein
MTVEDHLPGRVVNNYFEFTKLRTLASSAFLPERIIVSIQEISGNLDEKLHQLKMKKKRKSDVPPSTATGTMARGGNGGTEELASGAGIRAAGSAGGNSSSGATGAAQEAPGWKKKAMELNKNQILKTINVILNSLTDLNLVSVSSRLLKAIAKREDEVVDVVVDCLINSSMLQPIYVHNYALLCKDLDKNLERLSVSDRVLTKLTDDYFPRLISNDIMKNQYRCLAVFYSSFYIFGTITLDTYVEFLELNLDNFSRPALDENVRDMSLDSIIHSVMNITKKGGRDLSEKLVPFVKKLQRVWENPSTPMKLKFQLYDVRDYFDGLLHK